MCKTSLGSFWIEALQVRDEKNLSGKEKKRKTNHVFLHVSFIYVVF